MNQLLEQFLIEARDNLSFIDKNLHKLSTSDSEMMNALFRVAHTLKGGSGLVGLNNIKDITHYAEDLLDALRKNKVSFKNEMIDILYNAFDEIIEIIDAVEESNGEIEYNETRINSVISPIKDLLDFQNKDIKEEIVFNSELCINSSTPIAELISNYNLQNFVKNLDFVLPKLTQDYFETNNFYLLDIDLPTQVIELGNDPIYLVSLLGEENIISINTYIFKETQEILSNPLIWTTRLCVVVYGNEEIFKDIFYNILDDIIFHPLCIESLFETSLEKEPLEVFDDFSKEFQYLIEKKEYLDLSEKVVAICKILNPESKEYFILNRLLIILEQFVFASDKYEKLLKIACSKLDIDGKQIELGNTIIKTNIEESKEEIDLSIEKKAAIDIFKQQIKILRQDKTEETFKRVISHISNVTNFLNLAMNFEEINTNEELIKIIELLISNLNSTKNNNLKDDDKNEVIEKQQIKEKFQEENPIDIKNIVPKTVKINQSDIDSIMDIVGEVMVIKNSLPYVAQTLDSTNIDSSKREILTKYEMMNRIVEQLQDKVMQMRLLPLNYIFSRYPKLIRDISKKLNKKINYIEEGGETKLDKTMIEQLADPLVHIIRNSLDHGIEENEEDRIKLNKNPIGIIKISAKSYGDKVHIIVEDDGRGINLEKVISKALENNIASVEEIDAMNENEKYMLIFHPGLSTKDEINDLSGRGVGTDAVKKTVELLGGKIEITSKKDLGTTLTMILPVSVALTKVFHISMGGQNYAIPMEQVIETLKVKNTDILTSNHKPFITLRNNLIPILFTDLLLRGNYKKCNEFNIMVIQGKQTLFGLVVDEFVNQLDVIQKPLDGVLSSHPLITGTSLLGSGEILFIIDSTKLIN